MKHWFKRTKAGRALRRIRNFFWRLGIEDARWRKRDPEGFWKSRDNLSFE